MALWNRFSTLLFGGAIGAAARTAIEPQIEPARQTAWAANAVRILDLASLAQLVAEGHVDEATAAKIAKRDGHPEPNLKAMVELQLAAPGIAELMAARRRNIIGDQGYSDGLGKLRIHPEFRDALTKLLDEKLSPEVAATAIVRGLIPDPGILPVGPPTAKGKVPSFPVFNVDAVKESGAAGVDLTRLSVLVGLFGRPMAPEGAAQAYWRGIIDRADFDRAVAESDVRNEWRDAILEASRFILSPTDAAGLWLRGWITQPEAEKIGAMHGATPATMLALYRNRGRPATPRQIRIGFARGAKVAGETWNVDEAIAHATEQSDIRTEYTAIENESSWSYPSPFVLRQLAQAKAFTEQETQQILLEMGWKLKYATAAAKLWAGSTTGTSTPWLNRARSRLYTVAHNEYLDGSITAAQAHTSLTQAGVPAAEADAVVALWDHENAIARLELTPAQLKKAYKKGLMSAAAVTAELEARGMHPADVDVFLNE